MNQFKNQKSNAFDIDALIARLENIELSEALRDDYFHNTTLPILKDTGIMKYFGQLSYDDQERMAQDAFSGGDINNPAKWAQLLYGSILSNRLRLSTFLSTKDQNPTQIPQQEYYSNYKVLAPLFEADAPIDVTLNRNSGDVLFLKDPIEMRGYVRTDVDRTLYISASESGQYKDYLQMASAPKSEEGKRVKAFAISLVDQIKTAALADMDHLFKGQVEKEALAGLKAHQGVYAILLDSITFALLDLLNQGTYSQNYGKTFKGAEALLGNNLLADQPIGYKSLKLMNPEVAADITQKLNAITTQINPYMVDVRKMHAAYIKARSTQNPYTSAVNTLVSTYSNLVSNIGKTLGVTKFDFDTLFTSSPDTKAQQLLDLTANHRIYNASIPGSGHLRNSFLRIVSKEMTLGGKPGTAIVTAGADGIIFNRRAENPGMLDSSIIGLNAQASFLADDTHMHIVNEVTKQYGAVSPQLYARVLSNIETKADSQGNTFQGEEKTTKDQLLSVLEYLFNPSSHKLDTGKVLFALVPKLVIQGALFGLSTSTEPFKVHAGHLEKIKASDAGSEYSSVMSTVRPMTDIYQEFMSRLLDPTLSHDEMILIVSKHVNMVRNLYSGIWTHPSITDGGFGVAEAISGNLSGELSLNPDLIENKDDYASVKRQGISRYNEAMTATKA